MFVSDLFITKDTTCSAIHGRLLVVDHIATTKVLGVPKWNPNFWNYPKP